RNNALKGEYAPLRVIKAKGDPAVVAELEFGNVAVKVALAKVLVRALHSALENREVALGGIGVDFAPAVLARAVVYPAVVRELLAEWHIVARFIRHQPR